MDFKTPDDVLLEKIKDIEVGLDVADMQYNPLYHAIYYWGICKRAGNDPCSFKFVLLYAFNFQLI